MIKRHWPVDLEHTISALFLITQAGSLEGDLRVMRASYSLAQCVGPLVRFVQVPRQFHPERPRQNPP